MILNPRNPARILRIFTICVLSLMTCWGLAQVFVIIKPFRGDEWRLIYNIKFKSPAALWGALEYTQQFPRVYLQVMKAVMSWLGYSYISLRLPSLCIGIIAMLCSYRVMNKIFNPHSITRFFFVFLIVSSATFLDYYVQVKQYTMEMLLSVVAIWQMTEIIDIGFGRSPRKWMYLVLCISFFAAPFFSYTYPIAAAPVFMVGFLQLFIFSKGDISTKQKLLLTVRQWVPLLSCAVGILVFYVIDVSKLMADPEMHGYWNYRMITGGSGFIFVAGKLWDFFAQLGTGVIFEIIIGIISACAFFYGVVAWLKKQRKTVVETIDLLRLYSIFVVVLTICLFFAAKIPIEPKFNVYTAPSTAILIIGLMDAVLAQARFRKWAVIIIAGMYLQLTGNLVVTSINQFTGPEYAKMVMIYKATEKAIKEAQRSKLPIMVTSGVAYPDAIANFLPNMAPIPAASVLKCFPAYDNAQNLPVYTLNDMSDIRNEAKNMPSSVLFVMAGDGMTYQIVKRAD
jgi:hypothetical protein